MHAFVGSAVLAAVLAFATWAMLRRGSRRRALGTATAVFVCVGGVAFAWQSLQPASEPQRIPDAPPAPVREVGLTQFETMRPVATPSEGYVSSAACRKCHPGNHDTWAASYHRTMTQVASPSVVIGDFDDRTVSADGRSYRLRRRDDVCWAEMDDPGAAGGQGPRIERPIVMTTGSHHMQVYWYPVERSRVLGQLPLMFLKETQDWIPRSAGFLQPPGSSHREETGRWNKTCSRCHSTHPRARPRSEDDWDTLVAEFGIACEACHGPGQQHVQWHSNSPPSPVSGHTHLADDPIVNPSRVPHRRAAEVCGQCHSMATPKNNQQTLLHGSAFRPGAELGATHFIIRDDEPTRGFYGQFMPPEKVDELLGMSFWRDGMIRVSGREFNGLLESGCYQRGELSCLSCHVLHKPDDDPRPLTAWADDQLALGMDGDEACLQCHETNRYNENHTHHPEASAGGRCYNCHMPHTTYGLLKAIRSHQISSPDVAVDLRAGRPNACNLCHLDETLGWTAEHLEQWYGKGPPDLDEDQQTTAAALLWMLRGDAGQRALVAWSMGWPPAQEVSGDQWQAPFLAYLLEDPYDAVRFIAHRSLRSQPGFQDFSYDFVGPAEQRTAARDRALKIWSDGSSEVRPSARKLLLDDESGLQLDILQRLLRERDDRPVNLVE